MKKKVIYREQDGERIRIEPNLMPGSSARDFLTIGAVGAGVRTADPHIHTTIELLYILDGSFTIICDSDELVAGVGDLVLIRANTIHRAYTRGEGENNYFVIKVEPQMLVELADSDNGFAYVSHFVLRNNEQCFFSRAELEGTAALGLIERLVEEHKHPRFGSEIVMKTAAASLLIELLRATEEQNGAQAKKGAAIMTHQIYRAITYINANYQKNITARDCARAVGMSYSYFSRTFNAVTGKIFKRYLNEVRIAHAENLMLLTTRSVTDICFECGFGDASYFIAQYKAIRGKTPTQFRSDMR